MQICYENETLPNVTYAKFLGIIIENDWKNHT